MTLPPAFTEDGKLVYAIIESPKGNSNKYTYFPGEDYFKLTKVLPAGMMFPLDFGFIPGTKGDDGDPLDILIISGPGSFTGMVMECRIAGVITAMQEAENGFEKNDRIIAVSAEHDELESIRSIDELSSSLMDEVGRFFVNYNHNGGKKFEVTGFEGPEAALEIIRSQTV